MKKLSILALSLFFISSIFSQTENFDIASFVPPQGWQRSDAKGALVYFDSKTEDGLTSFCQIILYPSSITNTNANKNFAAAWKNLVTVPTNSKAKPTTQTDKSPDGWTIITGSANIEKQGLAYKTIVANISGFGKSMSVQVNTAGGDYATILDQFFNSLNLNPDSKTTNMNSTVSIKDYDFIAPQNWQVQNKKDHISILNLQSGCEIKILSPQSSSGNLETDARSVFDLMYKGWQYQKSGEHQYILSKGFLPKGLEYGMMEAAMSGYNAAGQYNLEEGTAFVIKAGNLIAIISARHNSSMLGHDDCYKNYNTWRRFFNSFTVRNVSTLEKNEEDITKRIPGLWKINATGVVISDYVFAANGHYQYGGAIGSSTTTSDLYYKYIYNTAYPFEGDGTYSISGNILTLHKKGSNPEQIPIRFEKVNYGGTGWTDRFWLLKTDGMGKNEVCYDKSKQE